MSQSKDTKDLSKDTKDLSKDTKDLSKGRRFEHAEDPRVVYPDSLDPRALLVMAQMRLRSALELVGSDDAENLLDSSIIGAGVLARDAGEILRLLFERRSAKEEDEAPRGSGSCEG